MGVYIKGMEMPKNCYDCPFIRASVVGDFYCAEGQGIEDDLKNVMEKRMSDCPLVELPPHGRLIDGDKFYKVMCSHWVLSLGEAYKRLEEFLEKPVIEAEGNET